jgi:transglutaminase-like putative cysteine protease
MLERLRNLPRDTRDTLFLLLVVAMVLAPQVGHLPPWCSILALTVLCWRGWLAWTARPLPGRWWLFVLLFLTIGATLWTHRTLLGRDAGVTLIVVLLTLKMLELRARRDAFVVFFLGFFTMLTNFFFSQSLPTAAAMLVALLGLMTALVNTHMPVGKPPLREAARTAAVMALLGAPIMAILFMLFPRLAPLWGIPSDAMAGRSGLSASMQVGSIASLALDDSVAMRIKFDGDAPRQSDLYFRGPVLSTLDGREWRALRSRFPLRLQDGAELQVSGPPVQYQVTLEPNNRNWIIVLDATPAKPIAAGHDPRMTAELQWVSTQPVSELLRYQVRSYPAFRHGPQRRTAALQDYLELPPGFNPRTMQWAAELHQGARAQQDPARLVDIVLDRLRLGGYEYTLDPGVFGPNTADEFWFDRKVGFCEHIASAFVVMMRALDIPARIVTGYQGGEYNGVGDFWVVRQSDAHAWAEVWLAGRGWVRVDPTAAVAPGRIGSLQRLQAPRGVIANALASVSPTALFNLRAAWDAMNNGWNQWVLNYSQTTQLKLLQDIGFDAPDWADLAYVLIALVVAASLLGAAWTLWERTRQDPWLRLLHRAGRRAAKAGLALLPNTPPRGIAAQVQARWGADSESVRRITEWLLRLEAVRYAPARAGAQGRLRRLQREFKHLPWPTR